MVVPLTLTRRSGPSTYNAIAQPLGVVVLALIAVCPLLAWRKTDGAELRKTLILPLVTAVLSVPLWLYLGFQSNVWGFIGLVVCGFAVGAVIQFVLRSARRAAGPGKSLWAGMGRAFTGSRTRTAAYVVHFGMILVVAGLIGSNVYKHEETALVKVKVGETASIAGYTLTYKGMTGSTGPQNSTRSIATFDVTRDGAQIGTLAPHTDVYPCSGAAVRAVILGRPFEDLFVVADEPFDGTSKRIALRMVVFPLVRWVWIGSILLCVGAAVSLWPKARRQEQEAREAVPVATPTAAWTARRLDGGAVPLEIEVEGLRKTFGRREVLKGLSFSLERGGFLSIFGPNGAGKTTTLRVLATLLTAGAGTRPGRRSRRARGPHAGAPHHRAHLAQPDALPRPHGSGEPAFLRRHVRRGRTARRASATCSSASSSATAATTWCAPTARACASGWRSRAPSFTGRACCCSTSRTPASTRAPSTSSTACSPRSATSTPS